MRFLNFFENSNKIEKEFDSSRRGFLKQGAFFLALSLIFPQKIPKQIVNFFKIQKEKTQLEEESLEEISYPETEKVPEFLQDYVSQFTSWLELIEDQKKRLGEYINSDFYENRLKELFLEYFNGFVKDDELNEIVRSVITKRISQLEKVKITPKDLKKRRYGVYYPLTHNAYVDTLAVDNLGPLSEDEKSNITYEIFTPSHELIHSLFQTLKPGMLKVVSVKIFEIFNKLKLLPSKKLNHLLDKIYSSDNKKLFLNSSIKNKEFKKLPYMIQFNEILSFLFEIRQALHIALQTPKDFKEEKISFDSNKDIFTFKHLEFLLENKNKILPLKSNNLTVLDKFLDYLKMGYSINNDDDRSKSYTLTQKHFIELMNLII